MNELSSIMINRILTHDQIQHITKRIAYQIYETNVDEKEIIIAGISGGGVSFAKKIAAILKKITKTPVVAIGGINSENVDFRWYGLDGYKVKEYDTLWHKVSKVDFAYVQSIDVSAIKFIHSGNKRWNTMWGECQLFTNPNFNNPIL